MNKNKRSSNLELGTAIFYVSVENFYIKFIKHAAVPRSKIEIPFVDLETKLNEASKLL